MTDLRTRLRPVPTLTGTPPAERAGPERYGRAEALVGRQSGVLADPADIEVAVKEQAERIAAEPDLVAPNWTLYTLRAEEVEFWQADPDRRHTRLRYQLNDQWTKELLWP